MIGPEPDDAGDPLVDGGVGPLPDADAGGPPQPGELEAMCGSVPATTADWERCRTKRFCETHVHCSEQNLYTNAQECIELSNALSGGETAFDTFEQARAVAAARASIDIAAFTQCLRELSPRRCTTAASAPSCAKRYRGEIGDTQQCFSDAECASPGATCEPRDCGASCCAGTCTPRARLGQQCRDFNACEPGLVCSVATQKCVTGDVGSACTRFECDAGDWCKTGTCVPDLAEGAPCDSLLQCDGEAVCVGLKRTAEPARCRRASEVGDVCDWFCLGNLYCDLPSPQGFGTCRALPRRGEPCSALVPCLGQTNRCNEAGMCVARAALDQPCVDGACLPGLFCTDQLDAASPVCRAPFADGQMGCTQDAHCQSHLCTGNQTTAGQCLAAQSTCQ